MCTYYNVLPGAVFVVFTNFKYDIARQVSEPHIHAKFEGLVLFGL